MNRPPTEMEKRVLDAILQAVSAPPPPSDDEPFIDWDAVSRAAIRALAEPSEGLVAAGMAKLTAARGFDFCCSSQLTTTSENAALSGLAWSAMIDAASPP